jgi:cell division initiation protein
VRITPIDIRKQEFRRTMRGYDMDEVDTFMTMVSEEMEELISSAQQAKIEVVSLKERLTEYQHMEATMRETLITVQQAAEEKREAAHKEADIILKEAEVRAGNWIEDTHRSIREIKKEVANLRAMRDSYVTRLKMLVQAQLDMLKLAEVEEETPDSSLEMFEERLEQLTAEARERVTLVGEKEVPVIEEEAAGERDGEPAGKEGGREIEKALKTAWQGWRDNESGEEREPDGPLNLDGDAEPDSRGELSLEE